MGLVFRETRLNYPSIYLYYLVYYLRDVIGLDHRRRCFSSITLGMKKMKASWNRLSIISLDTPLIYD